MVGSLGMDFFSLEVLFIIKQKVIFFKALDRIHLTHQSAV